jgi:hypothetical protein
MGKLYHGAKSIKPFTINVPEEILEQILVRVHNFRWAAMAKFDGWDRGTNLDYMKKFCTYWVDKYS